MPTRIQSDSKEGEVHFQVRRMKLALLIFCLCGPLLCLATETTSTGSTTVKASAGTVSPQNESSPKTPPADATSPVTYIKQEPVVEHKANLNDFIKEVLNVGDAPSSAEVSSSSSQTAASDEAVEDEVHQNVRIQELLKGILAGQLHLLIIPHNLYFHTIISS